MNHLSPHLLLSVATLSIAPLLPEGTIAASLPQMTSGGQRLSLAPRSSTGSRCFTPSSSTVDCGSGFHYGVPGAGAAAKLSSSSPRCKIWCPEPFRASYKGRSVYQVGLYREKAKAEQMRRLMRRNGLKTVLIREKRSQPNPPTVSTLGRNTSHARPLSIPRGPIPLGRVDNGSDLYKGVPPAPPTTAIALGPRYRVVVQPRSQRQLAQVRTVVPDAFRSSYRGRQVIQVGSFPSRSEAEQRMQLMRRNGFRPILEKTP